MSTDETQQGFPKIQAELVNQDRTINQVWLQLLITMWNRTGGAGGASTLDALLLAVANDQLARTRDDQDSGGSSQGFTADLGSVGGSAANTSGVLTTLAEGAFPQVDPLAALVFLEAPRSNASGNSTANLTTNHIFVGNASNLAADVAMSGDATIVASGCVTLANTTVTPGAYGNATQVATFTVNSKGLLTAAGNVTITSGGNGTVTSVGVTSGNLAIGGSPITSAGNITIELPSIGNQTVLGIGTGGNATARPIELVAGSGITITPASGNISISASGGGSQYATLAIAPPSTFPISCATQGNVLTPLANMVVVGAGVVFTSVTSATYKIGIAPITRPTASTIKISSAPTYSSVFTETTGQANRAIWFPLSLSMTAGTEYVLFIVRTDSTTTVSTTVNFTNNNTTAPGLLLLSTANTTAYQLASVGPTTSDTWSSSGGGIFAFQMLYTI